MTKERRRFYAHTDIRCEKRGDGNFNITFDWYDTTMFNADGTDGPDVEGDEPEVLALMEWMNSLPTVIPPAGRKKKSKKKGKA